MTGSPNAGGIEPISAEPPPLPHPAPLGLTLGDVTFLHWPVDPQRVRPLLPAGTEPDTYGGAAHVGLIAFRLRACGDFLETNVRVYSVDGRGRRGTVFLDMECERLPWALAGRAGGLPYAWSRMRLDRHGDVVDYASSRRRPAPAGLGTRIRVRPGPRIEGTEFEHFLTARWRLHLRVPGRTVAIPLFHERWPLQAAELLDLDDGLIAASGLPGPTTAPVSVLHASAVSGRLGLVRPL